MALHPTVGFTLHASGKPDVVSTPAAGPIRQEDGSRYYEEAWGGNNSTTVKFFESWSSIRSLYKHIYTSPAVERVFRSAAFSPMLASRPVLEGPFKVRCECLLPSCRPQPPLSQAPRATALTALHHSPSYSCAAACPHHIVAMTCRR